MNGARVLRGAAAVEQHHRSRGGSVSLLLENERRHIYLDQKRSPHVPAGIKPSLSLPFSDYFLQDLHFIINELVLLFPILNFIF